jgi:hypothetical protein
MALLSRLRGDAKTSKPHASRTADQGREFVVKSSGTNARNASIALFMGDMPAKSAIGESQCPRALES